jgi:hypothetical protein
MVKSLKEYNDDQTSYVYFILDPVSCAVKIGKADNIKTRLSDLQTGNPNPLSVIHSIRYESSEQAFRMEKKLHRTYHKFRKEGEWFHYDDELFQEFFKKGAHFERKEKRTGIKLSTLDGEVEFSIENFPNCYFYPFNKAQIKENYEKSVGLTNPFRTMEFPTNGKQMLLPWSTQYDRVFISDKKHKENLLFKKYQNSKQPEKQKSTLEAFF